MSDRVPPHDISQFQGPLSFNYEAMQPSQTNTIPKSSGFLGVTNEIPTFTSFRQQLVDPTNFPMSYQLNSNVSQPMTDQHIDLNNFYFSGEFSETEQWKQEYQRNNRNGGMKNIRCFPNCGTRHCSSGFCGKSLVMTLRTTYREQTVLAAAEISLSASPNSLGRSKKTKKLTKVIVGSVISYQEYQSRLRTRDDPFRDWWTGDILASKENGVEREISFEFNRAKRGWHYGWVANKYISNSQHIVKAYIFVPVATNLLKCVHISYSPKFRLYSRKPKRSSTISEHVLVNNQETKRTKRAQSVIEKSLIESVESSPNLDFVPTQTTLSIENFNLFPDDLFFGDTESIVNELKESKRKFKADNVFKMLQKLLLLSKEDFTKYIKNKAKLDTTGSNKLSAQYKEIVALRAFAAFLLSDDEDVTAELQAKMDNPNPFQSKASNSLVMKSEHHSPKNVNELLSLAQSKFNKFLSTFDVNVDFYSKFSEANKIFAQNIAAGGTKPPSRACPDSSSERSTASSTSRLRKTLLLVGINEFLTQTVGTWSSSEDTLKIYDKMYSMMDIPYALRKCYLSITGKFKFALESNGDYSSIVSRYNPKLFSAGLIRYVFDGEKRPWPIASPLIATKYDAVAVRAYVSRNPKFEKVMVLEHIYQEYKMVRHLKVESGEKLVGKVKLYEKWVSVGNEIEWNEILKGDINFEKMEE